MFTLGCSPLQLCVQRVDKLYIVWVSLAYISVMLLFLLLHHSVCVCVTLYSISVLTTEKILLLYSLLWCVLLTDEYSWKKYTHTVCTYNILALVAEFFSQCMAGVSRKNTVHVRWTTLCRSKPGSKKAFFPCSAEWTPFWSVVMSSYNASDHLILFRRQTCFFHCQFHFRLSQDGVFIHHCHRRNELFLMKLYTSVMMTWTQSRKTWTSWIDQLRCESTHQPDYKWDCMLIFPRWKSGLYECIDDSHGWTTSDTRVCLPSWAHTRI